MTSPVNAWTDDNDLRWYTFREKDYLSVTSMRKALGMPYNLHRWVVRQTLEAVQRDPNILLPQEVKKGKMETPANVRGRIGREAMKERDYKAERGSDVHEYIANGTPLSMVPKELQPFVESYANAVIQLGIKPLLAERQVFSDRYGYAGSFDLLATMRAFDGDAHVVDLKTGSGTYNEHALQGYAYMKADFVGENDKVDETATEMLKHATGVGVLHLHPGEGKGWTYHNIRIDKALDQAYRALCVISRWMVKFPDIESLEVK